MTVETLDTLDSQEAACVKERDRAERARRILADELFVEAWDAVDAALVVKLRDAAIADLDQVQDVRRCLKLLGKVRTVLEVHMETGKLAARQLEDIFEQKKRFGLFRRTG